MARIPSAAALAAQEEEKARMADLLASPPQKVKEEETVEEENDEDPKVVIVKIPARFMEDKVKTLMGSMSAQFEGTGYKVVFAPEEVDVYVLGQEPPTRLRNRF